MDAFNRFKTTLNYQEGLKKAQKFCAFRERCVSEMETRLKDWGVDQRDRDQIMDDLVESDFINEDRFLSSFVRGKFNLNQWGRRKIYMALREKGFSDERISNALYKIDESEYLKTASKIFHKKKKSSNESDPYKLKSKLYHYMSTRGYEAGIIAKLLDEN